MTDTRKTLSCDYQGSEVTFSNGENVMVNATQMAKAFGKTCKDWLRTEQAQRMIEAIAERQKCLPTDLQVVITKYKGIS